MWGHFLLMTYSRLSRLRISVFAARRLGALPLILGVASCNGMIGKPDVYDVTPAQAYQLLSNVDFDRKESRPFGHMKVTVTGEPEKSVTWTAEWIVCKLGITPVESAKSQISVSCSGGENERGVDGMLVSNSRLEVIEQIDATLKQRPYDPKLADGSTAFGWPADTVHHDGMAEAKGEALGTMSNMAAQDDELAKQAAQRTSEPATATAPQSDVPFGQPDPNGGKPTADAAN